MLGNLIYQTSPPDEIIVMVSEPEDLSQLREDFPYVPFCIRPNMGDWGHDKRAKGLELAVGSWVGFFNDDDSYERTYLEKMLAATDGADAVYCNWNRGPKAEFKLGSSTSGNYIVRTEFARQVGYGSRVYEADGLFINALMEAGARINKVEELLYFHNVQ
jgi:hypothetical protein